MRRYGTRWPRNAGRQSSQSDSQPNPVSTLLNVTERGAKLFAVFLGTVYVIGYAVTTNRLAHYGVPAIRLLDAQYFVAGLIPGLLVWLTIAVAVSALFVGTSKRWKRSGLAILLLYIATVGVELTLARKETFWLRIVHIVLKFVLGELSLWFLVVGLKTRTFFNLRVFNRFAAVYAAFLFIVMPLGLVWIALGSIPQVSSSVYGALPQAYGGGKPLQIELLVDPTKVPNELLAVPLPLPSPDHQLRRTIPLSLVLKTSAEYVVRSCVETGQQTWVLKADVVQAEKIVGEPCSTPAER